MANICRTNISIKGTKEAIKYFQEKYDSCVDGKYPAEEGQTHIIDAFGAKAELLIDRIGSKWISKYDVFIDADDEFQFSLESAWYPPSDMMKEIHRQLAEIDPDVNISGTYWDEVYDPCGVFKITDTGELITKEATPDESEDEFEGDFYWDEVIDPLFNNLKNILNR
jgi:hypothetical protein